MKEEYLRAAGKIVIEPELLINIVSQRVKQLRNGATPLVESLERLSAEDTALKEIIEGKLEYTSLKKSS